MKSGIAPGGGLASVFARRREASARTVHCFPFSYIARQITRDSEPNTSANISVEQMANKTVRRGRLLYEGRMKRVYETTEPELVQLEFKTDFPIAEGSEEPRPHMPKAHCEALIAEHIFKYLQSFRIPNHFHRREASDVLVVTRMQMIPVGIVVRNIAAGQLCQRYDVEEGRELEFPIVEIMYRNHKLYNPMVNDSHILAFGVATPEEIRTMVRIATKTNAVLRSFFERRHLRLVDFWLEFGRTSGNEVMIGDAITPDALRVIDPATDTMFDGSLYRLGIGEATESYLSLTKRLTS
jgi:phosphoribosylaminoimidazole-succinocarboxamide synthase